MEERADDWGAFSVRQESTSEDAPTVGGGPFDVVDVPVVGRTGFTHFLDGAQKSWLVAYSGMWPIYLAHTSATVLERCDRRVLPPVDDLYSGGLEAYAPAGLLGADRIAQEIDVRWIAVEEEATGLAVQEAVRDAISVRRELREQDVALRFSSGVLLVDGGIGAILAASGRRPHEGAEGPLMVGLVKSHRKQYFRSRERVEALLNMREGQRSSLFLRKGTRNSEADAHSFYLRMRRPSDATAPLHGLVRIELPPDGSLVDMADEIAGWVLHERAPLSLPDPRFDKMLYPTRLVEQHLKARQPSDASIRGLIGI
jgi:hypothetical protein